MDKYIDRIIEIFSQVSPVVQIFMILAGVFIFVLTSKGGLSYFQNIRKTHLTKKNKSTNKNDLLKHDFFINYYDYLRKIDLIIFTNDETGLKSDIFKTIIDCKLRAINKGVVEFVKSNIYSNCDSRSLNQYLKKIIYKISEDYNDAIKHSFDRKFIESDKIFELVMNSDSETRKGFNIWHSDKVRDIMKMIDYSTSSEFFNNIEVMQLFLYEVNRAMYYALMETKPFYEQYNGDLLRLLDKK